MRVEVVAVGTELLLGQIVDSNSSWIGEQLALAGLDSYFQTKVGDNLGRIVEVIELALSRSDAVICTGGLGPTQDDLTREAIAVVMGVPLEESEEAAERIIAMFGGRGRRMPMNNLRQAMKPVGAEFIAQQPGTAPGLVCPLRRPDRESGEPVDKVIYAVPGVPWEMQEMVSGTVLGDLQRRAGITSVISSRTLRTWGESESGLAEVLASRMDELDRLSSSGDAAATIAFLASGVEGLKVRLTAKADTAHDVTEILRAEEEVVRGILGGVVFGVDDDTMESVVLALLRERGLSLGAAESLTGGMVGSRICDVAGASDVFRGSVVSYASDVKHDVLGVAEGPVVTEDAARAMALGARRVLGADVGIAATGVAGPDAQEGRRPGTVCLAIAIGAAGSGAAGEEPDLVESVEVALPGRRRQVRELSVISLLALLRRHLLAPPGP